MLRQVFYTTSGELRPWTGAGLLAVCVILGYTVYSAFADSDAQLEFNLMCATPGCAYTDSRPLQVGDQIPDICPTCGKRSVYQALKCVKCTRPMLVNELRGLSGPTRCGSCGTEMPHAR